MITLQEGMKKLTVKILLNMKRQKRSNRVENEILCGIPKGEQGDFLVCDNNRFLPS